MAYPANADAGGGQGREQVEDFTDQVFLDLPSPNAAEPLSSTSPRQRARFKGSSQPRLGVIQSMGRVGLARDNAASEALHSTLKVEFVHRRHFLTRVEARTTISSWLVNWYNPRRQHSACKGMSPIDYERYMAEARGSTAS
jgi:transposase InsO family protein